MIEQRLIDIIGNIRISSKERMIWAKACLESLSFLKDNTHIFINVEGSDSEEFKNAMNSIGFKGKIISESGSYGETYVKLLKMSNAKYFFHFEEDIFVC